MLPDIKIIIKLRGYELRGWRDNTGTPGHRGYNHSVLQRGKVRWRLKRTSALYYLLFQGYEGSITKRWGETVYSHGLSNDSKGWWEYR